MIYKLGASSTKSFENPATQVTLSLYTYDYSINLNKNCFFFQHNDLDPSLFWSQIMSTNILPMMTQPLLLRTRLPFLETSSVLSAFCTSSQRCGCFSVQFPTVV